MIPARVLSWWGKFAHTTNLPINVLDEGWLCYLKSLALVSVFADNNTVVSRVKVLAL